MRDPDERMVHCLEAINHELHEMNKQLKMANQISILMSVPNPLMTKVVRQRAKEIAEELNLA